MAQIKLEIHAENAADLVSAIRDLAGSALVASHPVETAEQPEPETSAKATKRTTKKYEPEAPKAETLAPVVQEAAPAAPENPSPAPAPVAAEQAATSTALAASLPSSAPAAATDAPTFDQVRMVMADVMRKIGKASDIQELLQKQFGVASPNKLAPEQFGAAIEAMKAMIAGK